MSSIIAQGQNFMKFTNQINSIDLNCWKIEHSTISDTYLLVNFEAVTQTFVIDNILVECTKVQDAEIFKF